MSNGLDTVAFADFAEFPAPAALPPLDRPDVDAASLTED